MTTIDTHATEPKIREYWTIYFYDRMLTTAYSWEQVVAIVNQEVDPRRFKNGQVRRIVYNLTKWYGSYENGTRTVETIRTEEIPLINIR